MLKKLLALGLALTLTLCLLPGSAAAATPSKRTSGMRSIGRRTAWTSGLTTACPM